MFCKESNAKKFAATSKLVQHSEGTSIQSAVVKALTILVRRHVKKSRHMLQFPLFGDRD